MQGRQETAAQIALDALAIITPRLIVQWWQNEGAVKALHNALDDYFFDIVSPNMGITFTPQELDTILASLMGIAKARFGG